MSHIQIPIPLLDPHAVVPRPKMDCVVRCTDELSVGDRVVSHDRLFLLTSVEVFPDDIEREILKDGIGPCRPVYAFTTRLIETYGTVMPSSWADHWRIQGNWRALWSVVMVVYH